MKFGKSLLKAVDLSDPEWGPYWINYKNLKKRINTIVESKILYQNISAINDPMAISKFPPEVDFFKAVMSELKKATSFFITAEQLCQLRKERIWMGYSILSSNNFFDRSTWIRLLKACAYFYKDVLLLENFAIMNYCSISKILKKHDKMTGFSTREAFMRNVMTNQNITRYPFILELLKECEKLYSDIQNMQNVVPLKSEERLFLDAIRHLNYQASRIQDEENKSLLSEKRECRNDCDNPIESEKRSHDIMVAFAEAANKVSQTIHESSESQTSNLCTLLSYESNESLIKKFKSEPL